MSKLREKIGIVLFGFEHGKEPLKDTFDQLEKINDDFAVKFGVWLSVNCYPYNTGDGNFYYKNKYTPIHELLQIFKEKFYE